jgi:hypothetical protein
MVGDSGRDIWRKHYGTCGTQRRRVEGLTGFLYLGRGSLKLDESAQGNPGDRVRLALALPAKKEGDAQGRNAAAKVFYPKRKIRGVRRIVRLSRDLRRRVLTFGYGGTTGGGVPAGDLNLWGRLKI